MQKRCSPGRDRLQVPWDGCCEISRSGRGSGQGLGYGDTSRNGEVATELKSLGLVPETI